MRRPVFWTIWAVLFGGSRHRRAEIWKMGTLHVEAGGLTFDAALPDDGAYEFHHDQN